MKEKKIIRIVLFLLLIIGIILTSIGFLKTIFKYKNINNMEKIVAIYDEKENLKGTNDDSYYLAYRYNDNDKAYLNKQTSILPKDNIEKNIYTDGENILLVENSNDVILFFVGLMIILISLTFLAASSEKYMLSKLPGILMGLFLSFFGIFMYFVIASIGSNYGPIYILKNISAIIIFPIIIILLGLILLIGSFFTKIKREDIEELKNDVPKKREVLKNKEK